MEYVFPFLLTFRRNAQSTDAVTVYVESSFAKDDFDPDLFTKSVIEKEWKPGADRASIYKTALPELLKDDSPWMTV